MEKEKPLAGEIGKTTGLKPVMVISISDTQPIEKIHEIIHEMEKEHSANYTLIFRININ